MRAADSKQVGVSEALLLHGADVHAKDHKVSKAVCFAFARRDS